MPDSKTDGTVLSAIMDAAADAIVVSDHAGEILRANPACYRLFAYDDAELIGANVGSLMPADVAARHDGFMSSDIETGENKVVGIGREIEGRRKSGEIFPLHLSIGQAIINESPVFVCIMHDLSHRMASEKALARTMRLDAIGQMSGGIAHDFNNLLTVITGNLELAKMRDLDGKTAKYLSNALDAAELGAGLTARLMIFARKGSLTPVLSDLGQICRHTLQMLQRTLGENYRITIEYPLLGFNPPSYRRERFSAKNRV